MAVPSSPTPDSQKKKNNKKSEHVQQKNDTQKEENQKQKRSKDPGLRVVHGRIYDSQNGKTCHQCRQKTMDFTAGCKNMKGDKQCTIKFCHKCLLNRYGEKAEEMEVLDNWNCPKCRDICNCSFCRKKKGHKPTGILVHTAKATGYSSVSELLHVNGPDASEAFKANAKVDSPKELATLTEEPAVVSPKKRGKENSFDGSCNTNLSSQSPPASPNDDKAKKAKREEVEGLKERGEVAKENGVVCSPRKCSLDIVVRRSPRKFNITQEVIKKEVDGEKDNVRRSPRKFNAPRESTITDEKMSDNNCGNKTKKVKKINAETEPKVKKIKAETEPKVKKIKAEKEPKVKPHKLKKDQDIDQAVVDVVLPSGSMLTNVAGIDLLPDDAGYALQFMEFCSTFGEVLGIKKGQPESVLRDILCGRTRRKGKYSSTVQFLIQLLSFILKDMDEEEEPLCLSPSNGKDSWIHSLKKCLVESELELEDLPENCLEKGCDGYEMLDSSLKLKLLTFLCDESLSTKEMRTWIDEQNLKAVEKEKEAKETVNAAREKEKEAKRKLQEKVAKAVIAKNGVPLTIAEHGSIISKIKAETEIAHAELLEAMNLLPKKRRRSDAVRTEPDFLDDSGHAFWRLAFLGDSNILLQDVGIPEQIDYKDKWFSFNAEEAQVVEKYISAVRSKRSKRIKLANLTNIISSSDLEVDSSSIDDSPPTTDGV